MEVNCSQWETCDPRGSKVVWEARQELPVSVERCIVKCRKKSPGCLLLFGLQMAQRWVRGQSDNHIRKHPSPLERVFGVPTSWPGFFLPGKCLQGIDLRLQTCERLEPSMAHTPVVLIVSRLSTEEKLWHYNGTFKRPHLPSKKRHTLIRPITQQSSLINNYAASRVSEASPPEPPGTPFGVISARQMSAFGTLISIIGFLLKAWHANSCREVTFLSVATSRDRKFSVSARRTHRSS